MKLCASKLRASHSVLVLSQMLSYSEHLIWNLSVALCLASNFKAT